MIPSTVFKPKISVMIYIEDTVLCRCDLWSNNSKVFNFTFSFFSVKLLKTPKW